jgi:hypothetical protein
MNTLQRRTWWLSLLIMVSLLTQSVLPLATPARAIEPAPEASQSSGRSLAAAAKQLEQALMQLEEAGSDDAVRNAQRAVDLAWSQLTSVEQETRNELIAREQDLAKRGLAKARGRQASRKAEHAKRMDGVKGRYQSLLSAAGNRQAVKNAAAALRKDLREGMAAATAAPPKLDLLPNRPAPKAKPVEQRPALKPAGGAADQPS